MAKTYATITEAVQSEMGRDRSRYEIEHGITTKTVEGFKVIESVRMVKQSNSKFDYQQISDDFNTITLKNDKGFELYENAALTDTTIKYFIGGEFTGITTKKKFVKIEGARGRFLKDVNVKVKHSVLFKEFIVKSVIRNNNNTGDIILQSI